MAKENILLVLILPLLSTRLLLPLYVNWQAQKKLLIKNFEGKQIATAGGTIIFLALLFIYPFCNQMSLPLYFNCSWLFFYLLGIAILGAIDDFYGEKDCKGLHGHISKFWRQEGISTGIYKAAGGLLLGYFIAAKINGEGRWEIWALQGLFLALLSNFFNLLDTRPARAVKMFFFISFLLMVLVHPFLWIIAPIWGILLVYLPWEVNKNIMLGDTGAYLLGGILGFLSLFILTDRMFIFLNIILLLVHLFCEKFSLNTILEEKVFISYLVRTGRKN